MGLGNRAPAASTYRCNILWPVGTEAAGGRLHHTGHDNTVRFARMQPLPTAVHTCLHQSAFPYVGRAPPHKHAGSSEQPSPAGDRRNESHFIASFQIHLRGNGTHAGSTYSKVMLACFGTEGAAAMSERTFSPGSTYSSLTASTTDCSHSSVTSGHCSFTIWAPARKADLAAVLHAVLLQGRPTRSSHGTGEAGRTRVTVSVLLSASGSCSTSPSLPASSRPDAKNFTLTSTPIENSASPSARASAI